MSKQDVEAARLYHERTKHSAESVRSDPHFLDWSNQPMPYKVYTNLVALSLPPHPPRADTPALACIGFGKENRDESSELHLETIARLFFLSAGITKRFETGGRTQYFRAAPCTGALYHINVYLISGTLPSLGGENFPAGVYHLGIHDYAAHLLREGDFRGSVARASGRNAIPSSYFILTSTYWRNAWKYRSRTYRHCFWDSGTVLANLLAAADSFRIRAHVIAGFADVEVAELLGLDLREEGPLLVVELGPSAPLEGDIPEVPPIRPETMPLSRERVDYPLIWQMHEASSLPNGGKAFEWRSRASGFLPAREKARKSGESSDASAGFFPLSPSPPVARSLDDVILLRGSARRFERKPISLSQLSAALRAATSFLPADFLPEGEPMLNEVFLIANAVEGIPSGAYLYDRRREGLHLLREGDFRREASHLGLDQPLAADASVNVYFLSSMETVLQAFGNRGYRVAQLEAGTMGGRIYLAAYAQGLGASGLTFYDDDVVRFFGPRSDGMEVMFLVLMGRRLSALARY